MADVSGSLSEGDFGVIARFVEDETGIRLPDHKLGMVQVRVAKRVRALGLSDYGEYVRVAFSGIAGAEERSRLVDAITTNKTDFFREARHFEYLSRTVLPTMLTADPDLGKTRPIVAWCAACSTGEEPYSVAMTLKSAEAIHGPLEFVVHASDICGDALARARKAVYSEEACARIPKNYRLQYMLRSRDRSRGLARVGPQLRARVRFTQSNLLSDPPPVVGEADIVFCRNVLIYFNRETQELALRRVIRSMRPGGVLFVGHSEGLLGFDLPIRRIGNAIYEVT
jgi:chemotaxis protein methyltransferase CheR